MEKSMPVGFSARTGGPSVSELIAGTRSVSPARSASTSGHVDVDQRPLLLAAEDVGIAGAAARHPAVYRD
jgi:hypothetical protein